LSLRSSEGWAVWRKGEARHTHMHNIAHGAVFPIMFISPLEQSFCIFGLVIGPCIIVDRRSIIFLFWHTLMGDHTLLKQN
jgi:hypothetical protein